MATRREAWLASPATSTFREPLLPVSAHEEHKDSFLDVPDTPSRSSSTRTRSFSPRRRSAPLLRYGKATSVLFTCALLLCVSCLVLLVHTVTKVGSTLSSQDVDVNGTLSKGVTDCPAPAAKQRERSYVLGPPTAKFRDNLRSDTKYITSWDVAGWTNDVMALGNMIYLGMLTDRIPIIPPFTPSHVNASAGPVLFSDAFDIDHLSSVLRIPLVEWHEVKQQDSKVIDELGCWSVWETAHQDADGTRKPRGHRGERTLGLDISYTPIPDEVSMHTDDHASLWGLAALGFPDYRSRHLAAPRPSKQSGVLLAPDEQVMCFDILYYVSVYEPFEYYREYSPAWRDVVSQMRWAKGLNDLAQGYIRRILAVPEGSHIPPYIAIHFRRGDFMIHCLDWKTDGCFATLEMFAKAVSEVQEELWRRKGIRVTHVIMSSDEKDPAWWDEVAALGWRWLDHEKEQIAEKYGEWYPVLIDAVIQSSGVGFVGTDMSTMSLLAAKRTEEWHEGVSRTVTWNH
ncbi:hypothetical protein OE88DRAFT_1730116 [Heliocybe sulcata]|uniref:Uncharacterized protein n=1 Tax=Heliocybe sulcata TaxID=5364 RepID=A0A5C3NJI9_9AGAM|nr:hypothetical protein OE88DRAFT_1730116 [Heliocybe sulcata]